MNDYGLVSIITPNWNCAKFIGETIKSVQAQTYQNWEMIIVDDCSTDNSEEVVEPYMQEDIRIRFLKNPKNSGAAVSRNYAMREAKGKWIAFLDSDDLWAPQKLEKQIRFMVENDYHFSCHYSEDINEDGTSKQILTKSPKHISVFGMISYCWVGCLTVMYDAEYIGKVQIEDIKKNNDYAIWLKVIKKADCYCLQECLASYRVRSGSISRHSKSTLIKWHYKLWREAEKRNFITSCIYTALNILCAIIKKKLYLTNKE